MNSCKNCTLDIPIDNKYCGACGALVVTERISFENLFESILNAFGWESKFIITLRHMITQPKLVIDSYLNGTRKKYANPFAFLALMLTVSILIMTNYMDEYLVMAEDFGNVFNFNQGANLDMEMQKNSMKQYNIFTLKYQNIVSFVLIPFYSFLTFLIYRKKYNYSEHLIINGYITSIIALFSVILFLIALIFHTSNIFVSGGLIINFICYIYIYSKLFEQSPKQVILSILKFIGLMLLPIILLLLLGFVTALIFAFLKS